MTSSALAVEMDIAEQAQATAMEASQTAIVRIQSMRRAQVVRRDLRRQRDAVLAQQTAAKLSDIAEGLQEGKRERHRLFGTMDALMDQMAKREALMETQIELMWGQLEQTQTETKALVDDLNAKASSNQEGINTIMAFFNER